MWRTKDGREIDFEIEEVSTHPADQRHPGLPDKGYVIHRVLAYVDGVEAGYLKISYVPSARVPEVYPTLWHYLRASEGWGFKIESLLDTWFRCHWYAHEKPASLSDLNSYLRLSKDMAPDEATMRADLEALEARRPDLRRRMEQKLARTVDYAFVDYILVEEQFQRQGIAIALYNVGAQWLAETKGLCLHESGVQCSDAPHHAWTKMQAMGFPIDEFEREDGRTLRRFTYCQVQ